MLLLRIDIAILFASFVLLAGTFIKNILRQKKINEIFQHVSKITRQFKRMIVPLTMEETSEKFLEKTMSSSQDVLKNKKTSASVSSDNFLEMKKSIRKADVYIARGELENAEKYLVEALAFNDADQETNKKLALVYLKQEKYPKAELIYLKLMEQGTNDPAVYANLGLILYNQGRLKVALKAYLQSIELDPKKASRFANVGQIFYELQDIKNAIIYFERAHFLSKRDLDYLFILSKLYEEIGQREKAKYFYHKILDIEPYNEDAKEGIRKLIG